MSAVLLKKWQPRAHVVVSTGWMSVANETEVANPCARTCGQPGPIAIEHEIAPPADGTNCTLTACVPPGSSVAGPPPETTAKSPHVATTFRMSAAVPVLEMVKPACLDAPTAPEPKSSVVSLNAHLAP